MVTACDTPFHIIIQATVSSILFFALRSASAATECTYEPCLTVRGLSIQVESNLPLALAPALDVKQDWLRRNGTLPPSAQLRLREAKTLYLRAVDEDAKARDRAGTLLTHLAEEYPEHATIQAYLGSIRLLEARSTWLLWRKYQLSKEGLTFLDTAVAQAPEDLEIRFIRGVTTYHLPAAGQRSEQAAADLQWVATRVTTAVVAQQFDPTLAAAALLYHGLCREARADLVGARAAWHAAHRLNPTSSAGRRASERLQATPTVDTIELPQ